MAVVTPQKISLSQNEIVSLNGSNYTVKGILGEGGFGIVFKVEDSIERAFALKISKLWELMPQERVEMSTRIRQEFEIGNRISSKHLVKYNKYGLLQGNPTILMDYCSGGSLSSEVGNLWSDKKLVKLSKQILKGLKVLHTDGIIHRDIKPDNILFNSQGEAVIVDFGISASLKKRHTVRNFRDHVKNVWLTGVYSPPEQGDFSKAFKVMGPTNDVFAFGVVLFELISKGSFPHGSLEDFVNDMESFEKNKREGVWSKDIVRGSNVSNEWISIIDKCLKGNPLLRYTSVDELLLDIKRITNDKGNNDYKAEHIPKDHKSFGINWKFKLMNGDSIGQEFNLSNIVSFRNKQLLTLGWYDKTNPKTNDIGLLEIYSQYISSRHATLEVEQIGENQKWYIRDGQFYKKNGKIGFHKSKNGIIVNGRKIEDSIQLKNKDILIFGDTSVKVIVNE